jgi:hypothetical protein
MLECHGWGNFWIWGQEKWEAGINRGMGETRVYDRAKPTRPAANLGPFYHESRHSEPEPRQGSSPGDVDS